jgi:hypothetical protein
MLLDYPNARADIFITVYRLELIFAVLLVITKIHRYVTIDLKHKILHTEESRDLH